MEILIKAAQLILSLSILVVLHELGHFTPAKWFKMKVEKFYLFFDPWFSLFKIKRGDTEYGIGWIPLGGYVKISGMIDESMDKEQMKKKPEPWEFRSKPAWQRLIVMVGGVTMNILLAIFIYAMSLFTFGEKYLKTENVKHGIWCVDTFGYQLGFRNGDKIISVDGKSYELYNDMMHEMFYAKTVEVERNGERIQLQMPKDYAGKVAEFQSVPVELRLPFYIAGFSENSNAEKAGLMKKDKIIGVNDSSIRFFDEFKSIIENFKNKEVFIRVLRDGKEMSLPVQVNAEGVIGVKPTGRLVDLAKLGEIKLDTREFGFFESFPAGIEKAVDKLTMYVRQFQLIFNPETGAYKGVGSFVSIGNLFSSEWNWESFWELTAILSVVLAFMNILPIPALDGGHVMFLLYEVITRRKPSDKFLEYAQYVGMFILISIMVYALGNDILKIFK